MLALIDDVDDVAGKLPPALKAEGMTVAQTIWREVNRWPAYATLPRLSVTAPARRGP